MAHSSTRGSEWKKWDLHVHTPYSIEQDYGGYNAKNWERYLNDLESLPDEIKVLGTNDYIFIDGYNHLIKEKTENGRLKNIELLLPVIELRVDKFANVSADDAFKRINFHVIFSNEINSQVIQDQFLNSLSSEYKLDTNSDIEDADWGGVITRENLAFLGQKLIEKSNGKIKGSPLHIGFNSFNVSYKELLQKLKNPRLRNKFFTAVGKTEWESLRWDGSPAEKKSIINNAQFVFSASQSVENALKSRDKLKEQQVNNNLLHCSDAHSFIGDLKNTRTKELGHCFTWIKAQPIFEGLRQTLFEPEERVRIQKDEPDFKEDKLVIDEVTFISPAGIFNPQSIKLNKNLNVIIGGKSSGKSILLYNIAKTLLNDQSNDGPLKFKDSDDDKYKFLYDFDDEDSGFDFVVKLRSGSSQSINRSENVPSILPDIKYIPQNHLSNLVDRSRKQGKTLKKLIRNLILEEETSRNIYSEFVTRVKQNDFVRNTKIDEYFSFKDKLSSLIAEKMQKGDEQTLKESIQSNKEKIRKLNEESGLTEEQIKLYSSYYDELISKNELLDKINTDRQKIRSFNSELAKRLSDINAQKESVLSSIEIQSIKEEFTLKYDFLTTAINLAEDIGNLFFENETGQLIRDSSISQAIRDTSIRRGELENLIEPFRAKQESKKLIEMLEASIQEDELKLNSINTLTQQIDSTRSATARMKGDIFQVFAENYQEYGEIISALEPRVKTIEDEDDKLEIKGIAKYNFPNFQDAISEISDMRSFSNCGFEKLYDLNKTALSEFTFSDISDSLKNLFEKIDSGNYPIKRVSKNDACKKILTDWFTSVLML